MPIRPAIPLDATSPSLPLSQALPAPSTLPSPVGQPPDRVSVTRDPYVPARRLWGALILKLARSPMTEES